jgi:hypothetical protein
MDAGGQELYRLKALGATDAQLADLKDTLDQVAQTEAFEALRKEAQGIAEDLRTPEEKLNEYVAKLQEMRGQGLLTPLEVAQATGSKARELFGDAQDSPRALKADTEYHGVAALERGSVEARRAILAFQQRGSGGDPTQTTARNTGQLVSETKSLPGRIAREFARVNPGLQVAEIA